MSICRVIQCILFCSISLDCEVFFIGMCWVSLWLACKSLGKHHFYHFDSNNTINRQLYFYKSCNQKSNFLIFQEKDSSIQHRWATEPSKSVQARVCSWVLTWRPIQSHTPSLGASWATSWGTQPTMSSLHTATNTSEITHTLVFKCPSFTTWMKMFITLVQWNLTPSLCGCRLVEVLMLELLLSQLHEKCSCNSKTAQGFLVKQEQSEYKWLSQEKKPWNICSITSFLQKQILCSIIQDCMFVVNHSSSRVMVFVFHMRRTGHDI